jgi:hypothetical protein
MEAVIAFAARSYHVAMNVVFVVTGEAILDLLHSSTEQFSRDN